MVVLLSMMKMVMMVMPFKALGLIEDEGDDDGDDVVHDDDDDHDDDAF